VIEDLLVFYSEAVERVTEWLSRVCASDRSGKKLRTFTYRRGIHHGKKPSAYCLLTPMHADGTFNFDTVKIVIQFLEMNGKSAFLACFLYLRK
jgi:hypothetical protein